MKYMLRLISLSIIIVFTLSLAACSFIFDLLMQDKEEILMQDAISTFFSALDDKNANSIKEMFSKSSILNDIDLENKIYDLLSFYPNSATQILFDDCISGSYTQSDGLYRSAISSNFPFYCDGEYYWIYIEIVYEDDFCEDNIGVSTIEIYTADEYYMYFNTEDEILSKQIGFYFFKERELDADIISINGVPREYTYIDREIGYCDARDFIETNKSLSDFMKKYGLPNAQDDMGIYFYEVTFDGVAPVYIEIGFVNDEIIYANLVGSIEHYITIIEE